MKSSVFVVNHALRAHERELPHTIEYRDSLRIVMDRRASLELIEALVRQLKENERFPELEIKGELKPDGARDAAPDPSSSHGREGLKSHSRGKQKIPRA